MDTRRGANRARSVYTQEDFNDLSSGIRRTTIDTRFHLDRSRTLLQPDAAATVPRPRQDTSTIFAFALIFAPPCKRDVNTRRKSHRSHVINYATVSRKIDNPCGSRYRVRHTPRTLDTLTAVVLFLYRCNPPCSRKDTGRINRKNICEMGINKR
jgi:hypothetical protein